MSIPVLPTKLYAPPLRAQMLRRPALTAKLNGIAHYPLTLIAAPAGFGKTTLVTEWLTQHEHRSAWLALDEDDNEVGRFLTYLIAALRTVATDNLGAAVLALLQAPQPPPLRSLLHTLAHEFISSLPPCVLVLDDYHVISAQPIHEAVLFLLDHVPTLRWIINTRADPPLPLGRLRVRQQLLELRATDLRFRPEETTQLLNEVLQLALTVDAVQELQSKTEGWIAGLQLAALALQSSTERAAFIHAFYGSHRYVADYLADEVLHHLPEQLQDFLLQTAIVERLCAELCEALLDQEPASKVLEETQGASGILEYFERANLFLIPLDNNRHWYRYHHLFADLLRQRLQRRHPTLVPILHRRAAAWYAQHSFIDDAMRHLLAAQAIDEAADLLEQHQEALWMQGRFVMLRHWLSMLPPELIAARPQILLAQAWTHVLTDAPAPTIASLLQQTEAALLRAANEQHEQNSISTCQGILAAIRAVYLSKQEESAGVIAQAQQALTYLPPASGSWRSIALMALGFAYEMNGAMRAAEQSFTEAIHLCQRSGNHYSAQVSTMRLARTSLVQGQLRRAAATYTAALAEAMQRNMGQLPNTVHAYINLGRLHYEWNELAAASQQLQLGLTCLQEQEASWLQFEGYVLLARTQQAQGEVAAALALLNQAEQIAQAIPFQWTKGAAASTLVRARLALGQETGAAEWLAQAQLSSTSAQMNRLREADHFTAARVLMAQDRTPEALALLTHLIDDAERAGRMKVVIESCVVAALAQQQQGATQPAQAMLNKALTLAEPEGYLRTFVDEGEPMRRLLATVAALLRQQLNHEQNRPLTLYVEKIVDSFPQEPVATASLPPRQLQKQNLLEPLSVRELELLHLMAAGLSNQEIADRLIITLGTVKSHVNHIFGKLGVQGRVKAVNRARELALL